MSLDVSIIIIDTVLLTNNLTYFNLKINDTVNSSRENVLVEHEFARPRFNTTLGKLIIPKINNTFLILKYTYIFEITESKKTPLSYITRNKLW